MKFWKPSSPKKSKEPWDEPRWMRRRTSRTTARSGMRRFQPAARMLYHLALSEHSWAICRFPWVFWSLAYTDIYKHTLILAHAAIEESNRVVSRPLQDVKSFVFRWFIYTKSRNAWLMSTLMYTVNCERRRATKAYHNVQACFCLQPVHGCLSNYSQFFQRGTDSSFCKGGVIWNPWTASWNRPAWVFPQHSLISHEYLPIRRMPITPFLTPQTSSQSLSLIWVLSQIWACDSELRPMHTCERF